MDNPDLEGYNVDERISSFIEKIREDIKLFAEGPPNKHLIYTAGEDFHYQVLPTDVTFMF